MNNLIKNIDNQIKALRDDLYYYNKIISFPELNVMYKKECYKSLIMDINKDIIELEKDRRQLSYLLDKYSK